MLKNLIDNTTSDKDTVHSYIDVYESLFSQKKLSAKKVLEIGIYHGGSIKLWNEYFINADVYALDILKLHNLPDFIKNKERINVFAGVNAYNDLFIKENLSDKKFDMILDDGPHTLESMVDFIKKYLPLLTSDGILVIEDVQDIKWIELFKKLIPEEDKKYIQVFDLREKKNRWDDILFVINRTLP